MCDVRRDSHVSALKPVTPMILLETAEQPRRSHKLQVLSLGFVAVIWFSPSKKKCGSDEAPY